VSRRHLAALAASLLLAAAGAASAAASPPPVALATPGAGSGQAGGGPFADGRLHAFLAARSGVVTAAAYDVRSRLLFVYQPQQRAEEASIAKVDILATALYEAQQRGVALSPLEQQLATGAIEESDNDDAQGLWDLVGGNPAIAAFNARCGMTQTVLDAAGVWGHYLTSARDQVRLLEHIALRNPVLDAASRAYEMGLMRNVDPLQAWGVSAGVLARASVALKNGWLPLGAGWEINSIGAIAGHDRDYLLAVLTSDDPSMAYGMQTIAAISRAVWGYLLPSPLPPAPLGHGV
jgi:beta-lactamase class A